MLDIFDETQNIVPRDKNGNVLAPNNQEGFTQYNRAALDESLREIDVSTPLTKWALGFQGPTIEHDQIPEGLKHLVPEHTSVTQSQLDFLSDRDRENKVNEAILNTKPDTFLAKSSTFTTAALANFISPENLLLTAATAGTGELGFIPRLLSKSNIGETVVGPLNTLSEKGIMGRYAAKTIGHGSSTALAMGLGMAPLQYWNQVSLNYKASYWDDFKQNALSGAFGGFLGATAGAIGEGVVGSIKKWKVGTEVESQISTNAIRNQIAAGKVPDSSDLVDTVFDKTRMQISGEDANQMRNENETISKALDQHDKQIDSIEKPDIENNTTLGNLHKIISIIRKDVKTPDEERLISEFQDIPYYRELINIQNKLSHERTKDEFDLMKNANVDTELENINDIKDFTQNNLDELKQKIENKEEPNEAFEKDNILNQKDLQDKIDFFDRRIKEIEHLKQNKDKANTWDEINKLNLNKDSLQNIHDHNRAALNIYDNARGISPSDVYNKYQHYNSSNSDFTNDPMTKEYFNSTMKYAKGNPNPSLEEIRKEFSDIPEDKRLEEDNELSNHMDILKNKMKDLLLKSADCILLGAK